MNHLSWAINLAQEGKKMVRLTNTKWAKGNQLNRGQGGCTRCPRQEFVPQPSFPSSHDPFDNWSVLSWSFLVRFPNCHECHFQEQVGRGTCLGLSWSMVGHFIVTESLMLSHVTICCFSSKVLFASSWQLWSLTMLPSHVPNLMIYWLCTCFHKKKLGLGCLDRKVGGTHQ